MITKVNQPYEFLARWKDGKFSGSHIQFIEQVVEDGKVLFEQVGLALPVGSADFPLKDILDQVTNDAVANLATVTADRDESKAALAALQAKHDEVVQAVVEGDAVAIAAKVAEVQMSQKEKQASDLEDQIAELQAKLEEVKP